MVRLAVALVALAVFVAGLLVGYANTRSVQIDYLFGAVEVRLVSAMLTAFAVGAVLTLLAFGGRLLLLRRELRRLRRRLRDAETELKNLRTLPVSAAPGGSDATH